MEQFGPRFDLDWPMNQWETESTRWLGLKWAWRTSGHLRALLAVLTITLIVIRLAEPVAKPFFQGSFGALVGFALSIAFGGLLTTLAVMLLLGIVQLFTGWPLHEADSWYPTLPWYGQLGVLIVLLPTVCVPAIILVIASFVLSARLAGMF